MEIMNNRCPQKEKNSEELNQHEYKHIRSRLEDEKESLQFDPGDDEVTQTVALTKVPLYGNLQPSKKQDDTIRLLSANLNSVTYCRRDNVKVQRLRYIIGQYLLDTFLYVRVPSTWNCHLTMTAASSLGRRRHHHLVTHHSPPPHLRNQSPQKN